MIGFLTFCFACFGLVASIKESSLFDYPRYIFRTKLPYPLSTFLDCPLCMGFWAGIGLAQWMGYSERLSDLPVWGFFAAGVCWFLSSLVEGRNRMDPYSRAMMMQSMRSGGRSCCGGQNNTEETFSKEDGQG